MRHLKKWKLFESNFELNSIKNDVYDILVEMIDDGILDNSNLQLFVRHYDLIKIENEPNLTGNVFVIVIDQVIKIDDFLFEILERLNDFCKINQLQTRIARSYLPFEKIENFIIDKKDKSITSDITIIIYK